LKPDLEGNLLSKSRETSSERANWFRDAEKQLADAEKQLVNSSRKTADTENLLMTIANTTPTSTTPQSNSKPEELSSSTKMVETEKRMPAPGSRDAPKFKSSDPEDLIRFINRMEDLWVESKIIDDTEMKKSIVKYTDIDSEEEWSALDTFENGSWKDFKKEVIANYPEVAAAARGTPNRIRQICLKTPKVRLGDVTAIHNFRRKFMTEAKKLLVDPQAMSNRELVELFLSCLSPTLASAVLQFLGNKVVTATSSASKKIRPEDKYDLNEVCDAAIQVSENSQGMFDLMKQESSSRSGERDVFMYNQPPSFEAKALTDKVEELEGVQALERDRMVNMNKTIESKIGGLEDLIKTLLAQTQTHSHGADCKTGNCKMHEANNNSGLQKAGGKSLENERCFWCGLLGHFQADCDDLKNQIKIGNVKMNHEGKLRLKDGSFIPRYPTEASLKERVEKHYAKKPSQFYYGEYEENDPSPFVATNPLSQFYGTSNEDKRTIAQLKAELDLRKREEALELRQKMLEQNEKKMEQATISTRAATVRELLEQLSDDDLAALKSAKSDFH